jgi:hypothetical protein
VLTTPLSPSAGGVSPFPAIFVAAENLGLYTASVARFGGGPSFGDELDALALTSEPLTDCNGNGREDSVDIALGSSSDNNGNGIPDECERDYTQFCFCAAPLGPCGNAFPSAGCRNSTGLGALMTPGGSTSAASDDLVLTTLGLPSFVNAIHFMSASTTPPTPFFDGRKCLGAPFARFALKNSGASATVQIGPGLAAYSHAHFVPASWIQTGSTFAFQAWYRDPSGPCGHLSNLSSAVQALFTP